MTLAVDWDVKHKTKQTFDMSAAIKVSPTAELLTNRGRVIYEVSITLLGSSPSSCSEGSIIAQACFCQYMSCDT